jgi:hypothetical protein
VCGVPLVLQGHYAPFFKHYCLRREWRFLGVSCDDEFFKQFVYFYKYTYAFIMRGILTVTLPLDTQIAGPILV